MTKFLAVGGAVVAASCALIAFAIVVAVGVGSSEGAGCAPGGGTTIMGDASMTAAEAAVWFRSSGYADTAGTVGVTVEEMTAFYWIAGAAEGVRPEVAFVQAVVETGGFMNRDSKELNNFAGIGHCDSCSSGTGFDSPAQGVIAQIQLLKRVVFGNDVELVSLRGPLLVVQKLCGLGLMVFGPVFSVFVGGEPSQG